MLFSAGSLFMCFPLELNWLWYFAVPHILKDCSISCFLKSSDLVGCVLDTILWILMFCSVFSVANFLLKVNAFIHIIILRGRGGRGFDFSPANCLIFWYCRDWKGDKHVLKLLIDLTLYQQYIVFWNRIDCKSLYNHFLCHFQWLVTCSSFQVFQKA